MSTWADDAITTCGTVVNRHGQRITTISSRPVGADADLTVVLCPGFGQSVVHLAPLVRLLTRLGIGTVRFDPTNHTGLSEGSLEHCSLGLAATDFDDVLDTVRADGRTVACLVASSLGARPALRALRDRDDVPQAVLAFPAVDVAATIAEAAGHDVLAELDTGRRLPLETFKVGRFAIPYRFATDLRDTGLADLAGTIDDLVAGSAEVAMIAATADAWVVIDDVRRVEAAAPQRVRLIELEGTAHDFSRNLPRVRELYVTIARAVAHATGVPLPSDFGLDVGALVDAVQTERRWARHGYPEALTKAGR